MSRALLAQIAVYNHTQTREECWEDYGVYQCSSSKEGIELRQSYLLTAILHTNFVQAGCPNEIIDLLLSVLWNYSSTDCLITVIMLIFLLRGGGLTSLFHLVFNSSLPFPSFICLYTSSGTNHLLMTWFFPVTLLKTPFSHLLGI